MMEWFAAMLLFGDLRARRKPSFHHQSPARFRRAQRGTRETPARIRSSLNSIRLVSLLLCGVLLPICCSAADVGLEPARSFSIESVGARFGFPANSTANRLNQAEIFSNFNLPWVWNLGRGIELQSRLDLSLGWLGGRGHDATAGTLGPSLILSYGNFPVHLDFGSSPTVLSRHTWGRA